MPRCIKRIHPAIMEMSDYSHVLDSDSESCSEEKRNGGERSPIASPKQSRHFFNLKLSLLNYVLILIVILLTLNLFVFMRGNSRSDDSTIPGNSTRIHETDHECVKRLSTYTPALEAIEYYETDFKHSLSNTTKYRGPPTDAREKAWYELWPIQGHGGIVIEPWAMKLLNRTTNLERYEKIQTTNGEGYAALMEVHHQIECLNLIRKYTWFLQGGYSENRIPKELLWSAETNRMHVDSCIESLRLTLLCHGDMTPLLVTKERDEQTGYRADFNTHHKCRNFTKLQEWAEKHRVEG